MLFELQNDVDGRVTLVQRESAVAKLSGAVPGL